MSSDPPSDASGKAKGDLHATLRTLPLDEQERKEAEKGIDGLSEEEAQRTGTLLRRTRERLPRLQEALEKAKLQKAQPATSVSTSAVPERSTVGSGISP